MGTGGSMKVFNEQYKISYIEEGSGTPIVIFHGWGCNKEMFQFILDEYKERFRVIAFDLPGFGESAEPDRFYGTKDYALHMAETFKALQIVNPIGIGHSFGGRVLIKMAQEISFQKLVLTGSAGIVNKRPLSYYIKIYSYKCAKRFYQLPLLRFVFQKKVEQLRSKAGSEDYRRASERMRQVLSTVVNEDLREELQFIKASTLLIWGELDTATPLADGQLMEKRIPDAGLVVFEGATHYAFLEQRQRFIRVLDAFL